MIAILFAAILAAPPELPAEADCSDRLLAEWMYAEKLNPPEQTNVVRLAAKWGGWVCEPGSAERDAAADRVAELQAEKVERLNVFVR